MSIEQGRITNVVIDDAGSELTADAGIGATTLFVNDAYPFNADGGAIDLNGVIITYTECDYDAKTLTVPALAAAALAEDKVYVVPYGSIKIAMVDMEDGDEGVRAIVPFEHQDALDDGIRDPEDQEIVFISDETGRWEVKALDEEIPVRDGSYINPGTLPDPETPTDPPVSSPAAVVRGTTDTLIVSLEDPIEASTTVEYHISATEGFTPDSSTLFIETKSNVLSIAALPDGIPLLLDTSYYVRTIAKNVVGSAAPSAEAQGQLDPTNASLIAVSEMEVGFRLRAGRIEVGVGYWDPDEGLIFPQPDGGEIRLPVDGVSHARITAHLIARSLEVNDNAVFYNRSSLFGTFTMANGISNPVLEADVSTIYDDPVTIDGVSAGGKFGFTESSDHLNWVTFFTFAGFARLNANKSTGGWIVQYASGTNLGAYTAYAGGVLIGSDYYTLGRDWNRGNNWYFYKFDAATFAKTAEWAAGTTYATDPVIGTDGTNPITAHISGSGNALVRTYNPTTLAQTEQLNFGSPPFSTSAVLSVARGNFDLGANRVFMNFLDGTRVYCYNPSTLARVTANDFRIANGAFDPYIAWDGTRFYHLAGGGPDSLLVQPYDTEVVTDTDTDTGYTWYDSVGTTHESTLGSSVRTFTRRARSKLFVETPPAPQVGEIGDDVANQIRVYASVTGVSPKLQATLAVGERTTILGTLATTTNAPATNGFEALAVTPGLFQSEETYPLDDNPRIHLFGDGSFGFTGANTYDSGELATNLTWGPGYFRFKRIGNTVFVEGYTDRNADFGTSQTVIGGVTIPDWAIPPVNKQVGVFPGYGTSHQYRYSFLADGTIAIQRTGVINTFMKFTGHYDLT